MKNGTFGVTSSIEKMETLNEDLKGKCSKILQWYNTSGKYEQFTNMRNILSNDVTQIPDKYYSLSDVNDVLTKISGTYTLVGRIKRIYWKSKENEHRFYYPACTKCKKKLLSSGQDNSLDNNYNDANEEENIVYSCMNCDENNVKPFYNYTFNFLFMDFSGSITLRAFSDEGYNLLGKKAEELKNLDDDTLDYLFNYDFLYKEYKVVVRVNQKVYNGIERVNFTAMRIFPLKHSDISYLLNEIQLLLTNNNATPKNKRTLNDDTNDTKKQKI